MPGLPAFPCLPRRSKSNLASPSFVGGGALMSEGIALIFKFASDNGSSLSGTKTPESFFSATEKLSYFPPKGDSSQCPKRGEGPPKKHPSTAKQKGGKHPPLKNNIKHPRCARKVVGITSSLVAVIRKKGTKHLSAAKQKGGKQPASNQKPRRQAKRRQSPRPSKTTPNFPAAHDRKWE